MIRREILHQHYQEYASRPDEYVARRAAIKLFIVQTVLETSPFKPEADPVRVAVLGASDKRYIPVHRRIFEKVVGRNVNMTTFDLDTGHLAREEGTIEHDVINSLLNSPYDLIFSHELMKFLTPEGQVQVIINAHHALSENGLAMHIVHAPSLFGTLELRNWQYRVNMTDLVASLNLVGILPQVIPFIDQKSIDWFTETQVITTRRAGKS